MEINITLIIQMLVFAVFVWFTMTFVWPPLSKAMEERQEKIADGIACGERGRKELEIAQTKVKQDLREAKVKAAQIIDDANKQASDIIEQARLQAREEQQKIVRQNKEQLDQALLKARGQLRHEVVDLAILAAEKIIDKTLDRASNEALVNKLLEEIHG